MRIKTDKVMIMFIVIYAQSGTRGVRRRVPVSVGSHMIHHILDSSPLFLPLAHRRFFSLPRNRSGPEAFGPFRPVSFAVTYSFFLVFFPSFILFLSFLMFIGVVRIFYFSCLSACTCLAPFLPFPPSPSHKGGSRVADDRYHDWSTFNHCRPIG